VLHEARDGGAAGLALTQQRRQARVLVEDRVRRPRVGAQLVPALGRRGVGRQQLADVAAVRDVSPA
jgi:hypothetical protein